MRPETPKQFSARRLRIAVEAAKIAVMKAQEEAMLLRVNPAPFHQLLDAAFSRLDRVWNDAASIEMKGRSPLDMIPVMGDTSDVDI